MQMKFIHHISNTTNLISLDKNTLSSYRYLYISRQYSQSDFIIETKAPNTKDIANLIK